MRGFECGKKLFCLRSKQGRYPDDEPHELRLRYATPQRVAEVRVAEHANPREASGFVERIEVVEPEEARALVPSLRRYDDDQLGRILAAAAGARQN